MERERVIVNYSPYGILDKGKNSDGVNNLVQESALRLRSKGYHVILAGPLVIGKEEDNVGDRTLGKAIRVPRAISRRYGTSYPVTLPYFKEIATAALDDIRPDIVVMEEPFLPGFGSHVIMSGMPRREDKKPIPVTVGRFHGHIKWDLLAKTGFGIGKAWRRIKFDDLGLPVGFTDGMVRTIGKDLYGTAVSIATGDFVRENHKIDCEVIPNGIDTQEFAPHGSLKDEWIRGDKKIIFSSGRIEGRKGQLYLIEACGILKNEGYDFVLYLGGEGVDRKRSEKMVARRELTENVIFVGNLPWEEYRKALRTADVCVYPATGNEGFGRAPVEAVASGSIAVVSEIDGYNEAMKGMPFVLRTKPKDSSDIAAKIMDAFKVGEEKKREFGQLNHDHIQKLFGWKDILDRLDRFFDACISSHGGVDWSKWEEKDNVKPQLPTSGDIFVG